MWNSPFQWAQNWQQPGQNPYVPDVQGQGSMGSIYGNPEQIVSIAGGNPTMGQQPQGPQPISDPVLRWDTPTGQAPQSMPTAAGNPSSNGVPGWGTPPPGAMAGSGAPSQQPGFGTTPAYGAPARMPWQTSTGFDPLRALVQNYTNTAGYLQRPYQQQAYQQTATPQTIQGVGSVGQAGSQNPYLGQTTAQASAGTNPMAGMNNPYLADQIKNAQTEARTQWENTVAPQLAGMDINSGSYGNTGVQAARERSYRDLGSTLGNIATNARMQDYALQQQLGESAANRATQVNLANMAANAGDLNRNMAGYFTGSGQDLQGRMFDATQGMNTQLFNAGAGNQASLFNAGQGNQLGMWNAGQGNQMQLAMAGLDQNTNLANMGALNNMTQFGANFGEGQRRYNNDFDYMAARNAMFDPMALAAQQLGINTGGYNLAERQQMAPLDILTRLFGMANQTGGMGGNTTGGTSQPMDGNPLLGGIGGALTMAQLWDAISKMGK